MPSQIADVPPSIFREGRRGMVRWAPLIVELMRRPTRFVRTMFADYPFDENSHTPDEIAHPEVVTRFRSEDGRHVLEIERLQSGLYTYVEWIERFDDYDERFYLSPDQRSGLYSSAEEAERDARRALDWLTHEP
jgi:hypothetical protein